MLTTIHLAGPLGARFGRTHRFDLDVPSPAEAVRALSAVCSGFRAYLLEHSRPGYHVLVGKKDIGERELRDPTGASDITIIPVLAGAADKGGAILQTIAGGVLIAAGVTVGILTSWTGVGLVVAQNMIGLGASLTLGGVSQLLTSAPAAERPKEAEKNRPNAMFDGPVNTVAQGHPVPICYGEMEVGSQVVSAGLIVTWEAGGGFGGGTAEPTGPGGEPPVGGNCPAPWVPILLASGVELEAGLVRPGMFVRTQHEMLGYWGVFPVEAVSTAEAHRWRIALEDGREFVGSLTHRIKTNLGWRELHEIQLGEVPVSAPGVEPSRVVARGPADVGPVVKITVAGAHTYVSSGFLSHNIKKDS